MSSHISSPGRFIPDEIEVQVKAYNQAELDKLKKLCCWADIEGQIGNALSGKVLRIPREQFLLYSQFRDLDCSTIADLRKDADIQEARLNRICTGNGSYINAKQSLDPNNHSPEAQDFGVAMSLCVADEMFGTTESDWTIIPVSQRKGFDYIGSSGTFTAEVEAKGSFVEDPSRKPSTLSNHKDSIKVKKEELGSNSVNSARIGMIAAVGKKGHPVVRLVDPPVQFLERSPQDQQLLSRMSFLSRWISLVSPRSVLAIALRNRVAALNSLERPDELDGVQLVSGVGEKIQVSPYDRSQIHSRFFAAKSVVSDDNAGGVVVATGSHLFFMGLVDDLLELSVNQSFSAITAFSSQPRTVAREVFCMFSRTRFKSEGLEDQRGEVDEVGDNYVRFAATGDLYYTKGGLVFGWLRRPEGI